MGWQATLDFCREASKNGVRLHPQFTTNRLELHLKLADTFVFDEMPMWREVLTRPEPERCRRLREEETRKRLRTEWEDPEVRAVSFDFGDLLVEAVTRSENESLVGRSVAEIANERGASAFDTFLDLALSEDLNMSFQTGMPEVARAFIKMVVETGVTDPIVMAGSSDGGAHLASFTGADYSTRLLSEWVPDSMSLEQAIWRLAGMPATVHGLIDRGFLRRGAWADIVIFDLDRLWASEAYLARDFPAETERYVVDAEGYRYLIVAGEIVIQDGKATDARPGQVIRGA
jgi:N-acyl-D-aspartate/D-glutamate deacylase